MPKGNLMKRVIAEFDNAGIQEIELKTLINLQAIINATDEENRFKTVFTILHCCINMAVGRKGRVNKKEEKFIKSIFDKFLPDTVSVDKSTYDNQISEEELKLLKHIGTQMAFGPELGLCVLRIILGYAFSDGVLEDDLADQLERMFTPCLIADFMNSGEESVSVAGEVIDGIEVEIVNWLKEDDKLANSTDLYNHFKSYPRKEVMSALASLQNKNIIYKANTFVGEMYALTGEPYRIAKSERTSAKTASNSKNVHVDPDNIQFPVIKGIEGTGYYGRAKRFEKIHEGDSLVLKTDWESEYYSPVAIEVFNTKGETLGYLADNGEYPDLQTLALLVDDNRVNASVQSVTPLSKRRKNAKYALMDIRIDRSDSGKSSKTVRKTSKAVSEDSDRRVILENNLVIPVPEGMKYSEKSFTTGTGITRLLTAATDDLDLRRQANLDSPFDAARNISVNDMGKTGELLLTQYSKKNRINAIKEFLGNSAKVLNQNGLTVVYTTSSNHTVMMVFTDDFIYMCQYFINDVKGKAKLTKLFEDFIKSLEIYDPEAEQHVRTVKQQEPEVSSENSMPKTEPVETKTAKLAMPEHSHFEVTDDLESLKKYIISYPRKMREEITDTNNQIRGVKPITRANDKRITMMRENTRKLIDEYTETLKNVVLKLDEIGEKLWKDKTDEKTLKEIIDYIDTCRTNLKKDITVELFKNKEEFSSSPDQDAVRIIRKWKRRYNELPKVRIENLTVKVKDNERELKDIRKTVEELTAKKTASEKKLDELKRVGEKLNQELAAAIQKKEEWEESFQAELERLNSDLQTNREKLNSIESIISRLTSIVSVHISSLNIQKEELTKALASKTAELSALKNDEDEKKIALKKTWLFKKGKQTAYDEAIVKRLSKEREVKEFESKIDALNEEIRDLQVSEGSKDKDKKELEGYLVQKRELLESNKQYLSQQKELENKRKNADKKISSVQQKIQDNDGLSKTETDSLKETEDSLRNIDEKIKELAHKKTELTQEIAKIEETRKAAAQKKKQETSEKPVSSEMAEKKEATEDPGNDPAQDGIKETAPLKDDSGFQAAETITVGQDFRIALPKGKYSFNPEEIGDKRCIVFISDETNEYYMEKYGEESLAMSSLAEPFSAPRCLLVNTAIPINSMRQFALMSAAGVAVELKNPNTREGIQTMLEQLWSSVGNTNHIFLTNDTDLLVGFSTKDYNAYMIGVAAGKNLYIGQIWINDEEDTGKAEKAVTEWLNTIEPLTKRSSRSAKNKQENAVFIGSWPQTDENTPVPIEWQVLKEEEDRTLLITKDLIIYKPIYESEKYPTDYQEDDSIVFHRYDIMKENPEFYTWKGGTLRTWLNTDFYDKAFTAEEKERIQTARYFGEVKKKKEYIPTEELEDKIFILSAGEATEFFKTNPKRKAKWSKLIKTKATAHYVAYWGDECGDWWLRTDCGDGMLSFVSETGSINKKYADMENSVRPAIWIKNDPDNTKD